jgi:hypothetical protein
VCTIFRIKTTVISTPLISRKKVKAFALEVAEKRYHRFTRVGDDFYLKCEGALKDFIRRYVHQLPSKGKTIK